MSTRTRNVTENNEALPRPPIIGISTTEPATDRRLNWPNDLSILLEDLRTSYSVTERVIGRAGYLFRKVYELRTEKGDELVQLQSEWRERTPIHALKLIMFRNDIKSAFVAHREVVPVDADILVDLAERLNSLCVVATLHFRRKLHSRRARSVTSADGGREVAFKQSGGKDRSQLNGSFWSCAEADDVLDQRSEFPQVLGAGQSRQKLFSQHFPHYCGAAIRMRRSAIGVVPRTVAAVGQLWFCDVPRA